MRRVWLVLAVAAMTGCGSFRDLFSAHADVVAEAGGQKLTADRVATIMTTMKGIRSTREASEFLANLWVDYTLFSQAVATHGIPSDSARVAKSVWPELAEIRGSHWHDTLLARRNKPDDHAVDGLYNGSQYRMLQHVLFRVAPNSPPPVSAAARKKADAVLAKARSGGNFNALAFELSEDPASKADSGFLPPSEKGAYVTAFDSAGWRLAPGALSGVVETPFGFHVLYRPTLEQSRPRLLKWLSQQAGAHLDSLYMDSLAARRKLTVSSSAPTTMRAALADRYNSLTSTKTIASYSGGELTVGEFVRWANALGPQFGSQFQQAPDSALRELAKVITQNILLLQQADSAGIRPTPEEWSDLRQSFLAASDSLRDAMGLNTPDVTDTTQPLAERLKVAALKLDGYLDQIMHGKVRPRPMPSQLASVLRENAQFRINQAGVARALQLAQAERAQADSTNGKALPPGHPGMQPAPGPAPIPGGTSGGPAPSGGSPKTPAPATAPGATPKP
ncbi:MAG: peptidylprolyl isomerase [Gemmatimonadota bacterium]